MGDAFTPRAVSAKNAVEEVSRETLEGAEHNSGVRSNSNFVHGGTWSPCTRVYPIAVIDPTTLRERVHGAMFGLAVRDALGAPLEGARPSVAAATVASGLTMVGNVFWAPGEWTDDTAMALALAESIGAHELLNTADLARRYIEWATHDGKGIGNATSRALVGARDAEDARDRARAHHEAAGLAAGNGTVMRATPIALVARKLEQAVDAALKDAMLTHGDPVAGMASAALCSALIAL
jgi:ADP-ribosylglycohydrolase